MSTPHEGFTNAERYGLALAFSAGICWSMPRNWRTCAFSESLRPVSSGSSSPPFFV